jgi:hypothetical protein
VGVVGYWKARPLEPIEGGRDELREGGQSLALKRHARARGCAPIAPGGNAGAVEGMLPGPAGRAMSPTHTRRGGKLYRYYVCQAA